MICVLLSGQPACRSRSAQHFDSNMVSATFGWHPPEYDLLGQLNPEYWAYCAQRNVDHYYCTTGIVTDEGKDKKKETVIQVARNHNESCKR